MSPLPKQRKLATIGCLYQPSITALAILWLLLLNNLSLKAQDKIYYQNEVKDGQIIDIEAGKIKYRNPLNPGPTYTVSKERVAFAFSKEGGFYVVPQTEATALTTTPAFQWFFNQAMTNKATTDRIYTLQKKTLNCEILKEDDQSFLINLNTIELKIEKSTIAVVIYKSGNHKIISSITAATDVLKQVQEEMVATAAALVPEKPVKSTMANIKDPAPAPKTKPAVTAPKPTVTSAVISIQANKGSDISFSINDGQKQSIPKASSKKINSEPGNYSITMTDKLGTIVTEEVVITNADLGKTFPIVFPEIDYVAFLSLENKKKKAESDSVNQQKAQAIQEKNELLLLQKKEQTDLLTQYQAGLSSLLAETISLRILLQKQMDSVKAGTLDFEGRFSNNYVQMMANKTVYDSLKKAYAAKATEYKMQSSYDNFRKKTAQQEPLMQEKIGEWVNAVQSAQKPKSQSLAVAINSKRVEDLPFFIAKDSINEQRIGEEYLINHIINNNLDSSIARYLINNGADPNYFGKRFPDAPKLYKTPIMTAALNGNMALVKVLGDAKAAFYPGSTTPKERKDHMRYLSANSKNPATIGLLKKMGYDMNDGSEERAAVIKEILDGMVKIEGGRFSMGCTEDQANDCVDAEKPLIDVTLNGFQLSKFELKRYYWEIIMEEEYPGQFKECKDCPVESVQYDQVMAFIKQLNQLSGKQFRLPTEAEWEFAARGGMQSKASFKFAGSNDFNEVSHCKDNTPGKTLPVAQKKPNALGLFDMSGNVAEWCSDWFVEKYYAQSSGNNPKGPEQGFQKVIRGGAWNLSSWSSRVSRRIGLDKNVINNGIGFRLALD